jgi:hypothetical protein
MTVAADYPDQGPVRTPTPRLAAIRSTLRLVGALLLLVAIVACEGATGSPRPSPSLVELDFTPQPSATVPSTATPSPAASATREPNWPTGWLEAFCAALTEAVIVQELVVDVERAMEEEDVRDARGLARDLTATATAALALTEQVPEWQGGEQAMTAISTLVSLGAQMGPEYEQYLTDESRGALRRARNLRRENAQAVPGANDELDSLTLGGVTCPSVALRLESP